MQFINEIKSGKRRINPAIVKAGDILLAVTWSAIWIYLCLWVVGIDLIRF